MRKYLADNDIFRCLTSDLEGWCLLEVSTMKQAIQEIVQYVNDHPEMTTRTAVDAYFDQILFSLEKQEWSQLTDKEKQSFVASLDASKGRPPKGPGRR